MAFNSPGLLYVNLRNSSKAVVYKSIQYIGSCYFVFVMSICQNWILSLESC